MKKASLIIAILTAIIFSGCFADPKEANNENFTKAINEYLTSSKQKLNCFNIGNGFPKEAYINEQRMKEYENIGLLKSKTMKVEIRNMFLMTTTNKKEYKDALVYDLTDAAKAFYKNGRVCVGKVKVDEIINFTDPSEMMGQEVSTVKYKYLISDLPVWLKKAPEPKVKKDVLILSGKGWIHSKLF